ncbi:MAG: hypothetical protein GX970_13210 [Phyllobacteriaceae bacterium]|nr:hypothetical protein [Phyllobacteriaceae bacterium]
MLSRHIRFALPFRLAGFLLFQLLIAVVVGWENSSAWWPIAALLTNLATILLLVTLTRREGLSYWSILNFSRADVKKDLFWLLPVLILAMPLAYIPNIGTAALLFGNPEVALEMFLKPLPVWAAVVAIAFSLTIIFAELPLYFGYVMPRIAKQTSSSWLPFVIPAIFLSIQHVTLPLIVDVRFMLWRAVMFLPFAMLVGFVVKRRPSLLPYLVVLHGIIDLGMVAMLLPIAY